MVAGDGSNPEKSSSYGCWDIDDVNPMGACKVKSMVEKAQSQDAPSNLPYQAAYILSAECAEEPEPAKVRARGGNPTDNAIRAELTQGNDVYGYRFKRSAFRLAL